MRSSGMLPAALIPFASLANAQEYKSGINWPEPKVITPGTNGGAPSDAIVLFDGKEKRVIKVADIEARELLKRPPSVFARCRNVPACARITRQIQISLKCSDERKQRG